MKHSARRIFFFSYTSHVAGHHKFMEIFVPRKQLHNCGIFTYQEQKSQQQAVSDQVPVLTKNPSRQTYSTHWQLPQKQQHQFISEICHTHRSSNTRINITFLQEKRLAASSAADNQKHSPDKLTKLPIPTHLRIPRRRAGLRDTSSKEKLQFLFNNRQFPGVASRTFDMLLHFLLAC